MVTVGCGDTSPIDSRALADSSAEAARESEPEVDAASEDLPAADVPIDVPPAPVPFDALDEARGIDVYGGVAPDGRSSCPYPDDTRVDNNGNTLWWWRFDWQQADLASLCASHGADAKMVIEHRMQGPGIASALPACTNSEVMGYGDHACAMAGLVRLEVACTAGYVLFEATKDWDVVHWGGGRATTTSRAPQLLCSPVG
jgi:hypothetical protein